MRSQRPLKQKGWRHRRRGLGLPLKQLCCSFQSCCTSQPWGEEAGDGGRGMAAAHGRARRWDWSPERCLELCCPICPAHRGPRVEVRRPHWPSRCLHLWTGLTDPRQGVWILKMSWSPEIVFFGAGLDREVERRKIFHLH